MADVITTLKLLVVGNSATGKSSLLMRFIDDSFDEDQGPTIGVDFKSKIVNIDGNKVKLTIWDTAGQERFRTLTASYYRGAHGVIMVYDVSVRETFKDIAMWLSELDVYAPSDLIVKMLVGNKIDKPNREVSTKEGLDFAREKSMLFIECSAKNKIGVKQAFDEVTTKILETPALWSNNRRGNTVQLGQQSEDNGGCAGACRII
eukprot:m.120910 g.120910  ORF g.120910 m.120910 type:complete len:204 (-) comp28839_c2_seq1:163-774(-)